MWRELDWGGLVGFQGEVDFSGFPVFADFHQDGGDESQERGLVGEQRGDAGAAFDFLVEAFQHVAGSQPATMLGRQGEHGQPFGHVGFHPGGQLAARWRYLLTSTAQSPLGFAAIGRIEHAAQVAADLAPHGDLGHVVHGVLHQVELAALPRHAGEAGPASLAQPGMVVAGDQPHAVQAAVMQRA